MTVGSGSTPEVAARLVSMLDSDSGYGGSMMDVDGSASSWRAHIGEDRPSPSPGPVLNGESSSSEHDRQRSHVLQLRYNQNKNALGRAIHGTIDTLKSFQEMNLKWLAHYPTVQTSESRKPHARNDSRPGLQHTQSALGDFDPSVRSPERNRPRPPRRAGTTIGDNPVPEAGPSEEPEKEAPRLVTPQLAQDFSVLKLELRMGGRTQTDLGPANDVRIGLQRNVENLQNKKEQTSKFKQEAEVARKYFGNLVRSSNDLRQTVQRVDLEAAPPAAVASPTY